MKTILKSLIGSRAHGLNSEDSDYDYRGVFVTPLEDLLRINNPPDFVEDGQDVYWEVRRFIGQALKCNPTVLEVLASPVCSVSPDGQALRELFPSFLSRKYVRDAFKGFAQSQKRKYEIKEAGQERLNKFLCHYLRTLYSGIELLETGCLSVNVTGKPYFALLLAAKQGQIDLNEGLNHGKMLEERIEHIYLSTKIPEEPDLERINKYLFDLRTKGLFSWWDWDNEVNWESFDSNQNNMFNVWQDLESEQWEKLS